jgi:phosphoglycolate phosphatase
MKPKIFLFDIDGTILSTHGAGRKSIDAAFGDLFQRPDACAHFSFSGMTDVAIVRLGLEAIGVEFDVAHVDRVIAVYLKHLALNLGQAQERDVVLHPGVRECIAACRIRGAVGLGTGNVKAGAKLKLARVSLYEQFDFGGFGCDAEARADVLRVGAQRGATHLELALEDVQVIVIGDTPKDVAAAHAIGAKCLAVETGQHTKVELISVGANWVFEDLRAPGVADVLLA